MARPVRASLMITCLGDMFFPEVGVKIVRLLRRLGVTVEFPAGQTSATAKLASVTAVHVITGPTRTADIELTLTRGVHGPKEVHAMFVDAPIRG